MSEVRRRHAWVLYLLKQIRDPEAQLKLSLAYRMGEQPPHHRPPHHRPPMFPRHEIDPEVLEVEKCRK